MRKRRRPTDGCVRPVLIRVVMAAVLMIGRAEAGENHMIGQGMAP